MSPGCGTGACILNRRVYRCWEEKCQYDVYGLSQGYSRRKRRILSVWLSSVFFGTSQRQTGERTQGLIPEARLQCEIYTEMTRMAHLNLTAYTGRLSTMSYVETGRASKGEAKDRAWRKSDWRCRGLRFQTKERLSGDAGVSWNWVVASVAPGNIRGTG